ncbi:metal-sulfur cluster assembly factor [Methylobacterium sp. UNC378MF]|uniref:metal-sulfur cluster assembly factor n=1 Tax=Methylobacterium sp. UNC378MF TaxID=1502748 RepID=UPI000B851109|nr:metal-sulfur cluster assembly factor [Methylobacterium sp. UNC378MF]
MLSWLRGRAMRRPSRKDAEDRRDWLDPDIIECLTDVLDPEVGISVVHLGLVYRAVRTSERIDVDLTLTARTCPLAGLIVDDARACLRRRFNDCPAIVVRLVWTPIWTPDRMTERGLALLGHPPRGQA